MRIYTKGLHGKLWDLEDGREILRPVWFDEAAGTCECCQTNPFGRIVRDRAGDKLTWLLKGQFKWVPDRPAEITRRCVGQKCMECTADAEWAVGDDTPLPAVPGILNGVAVLFSRGRLAGKRFYCSRHYKAPRIVDAKGEVMETWEEAGGVRPQWHS